MEPGVGRLGYADDGSALPEQTIKEFEPLRKRPKLASTEIEVENNYMPSYYNPAQEVLNRTADEIRQIRVRHEITVRKFTKYGNFAHDYMTKTFAGNRDVKFFGAAFALQVRALVLPGDSNVNGDNVPSPILSWAEANLQSELAWKLYYCGYYEPTPIQKQAVPAALSGRDILATADTGSGKTLAYLIPMISLLNTQPPTMPGQGPLAIILAPTRELVQQIYTEAHRLLSPWHVFAQLLQSASSGSSAKLGMMTQQQYAASSSSSSSYDSSVPQSYQHSDQAQSYYQYGASSIHPLVSSTGPVSGRKVLGVVGGLSVQGQISTLKTGIDVIVATPGRLLDLLARHAFSLDRLRYLVFDEIDRMLEQRVKEMNEAVDDVQPEASDNRRQKQNLGSMEDQLRRFVAQCSFNERQTLLFSATMPQGVVRLARSAVLDPVIIKIGSQRHEVTTIDGGGNSSIPKNIKQKVIFLQTSMKNQKLLDVLRKTPAPPVIIFCDHITTVDRLVDMLRQEQFHVAGLHSEKSQEYRFKVVETMRNGRLDVLVATDLASRGLDFHDITHVIQYDIPDTIEDYIHRVGRTGRAGRDGWATAFLTYNCKIAPALRKLLIQSGETVPAELENNIHMFGHKVVVTEFGDKVIFSS